ncbi:MAG: NAD(P)-binding domain-containing protein [Gemmatimonadaceae bacterium]|nr:NAD(P)-binding domain-containing protein [Gemmatimonadaceae bacterium]
MNAPAFPRPDRIAVIGAGPSGITAVKNLLDAGFRNIVCYDRNEAVGGNWLYHPGSSHSSVFETTHIISSKSLSQYHDFPMPSWYPDYPSHTQLAAYFQSYARHFGLEQFVRFGTEVHQAEPTAEGSWQLTVECEGVVETSVCDALVVANGHHWRPRAPTYPGSFTGTILHSHDFKRAAPFAGQRVLVIGGGNSACDVAVETSRVSAHTDLSWRRGYWIVPKFLFGQPSDIVGAQSRFLPRAVRSRINAGLLRLLQGPNSRYGLQEPDHAFGATHPTVNSELLYALRHGHIGPRPDIARFDGRVVHFTDGSSAEYDVIIACTGYWISHPFFRSDLIDFSKGPVPLYLRMFPARFPSLAFVGLFQPLGCIWPAAELQAKVLARRWSGAWTPPADLEAAISRELRHPDYPQVDSPRHTITVDYHRFKARLLRQLPGGWRSTDPVTDLVDIRQRAPT